MSRRMDSGFAMRRRSVLGIAGLGTAVTVLGACDRGGEGPGPESASAPPPSTCREGAVSTAAPSGASDGGGRSDVQIDPSLMAPAALAVSPDGALLAAAVSPGAKQLGTVDSDGTTMWTTVDGRVATRFDNGHMGALAWHPDGSLLAIGGFRDIELASPEGEVRWTLTGSGEPLPDSGLSLIQDLVFSDDGQLLTSLGADGMVRLWTGIGEAACTPGEMLDTRALLPRSIALSPDGATLAVCGPRGAPQLWDVATATLVSEIEGVEFSPHVVAYGPDGTVYIGSGVPETYQQGDPEQARLYALGTDGHLMQGPDPEGVAVGSLAVHPEGTQVAVLGRSDRRVMLWDRSTDTRSALPEAPASGLDRLAWSPDGVHLFGVSRMDGVLCWDGTAWAPFDLP